MAATWWTNQSQLDDDQKAVVALEPDGHHLVLGPPGSGKTNLLLLRATYLYKRGTINIAIIAFGRVLREFLATGSAHYPFSSDKIQTYVKWAASLLNDNGIELEGDTAFDATRKEILEKLRELAEKNNPQNIFDCILLDEAQDYSAEEIEIISRFATRLFAVGDDLQRITDRKGALDSLKKAGLNVVELETHYRNGLQICRVADGIRNQLDDEIGLEATSNYDEVGFPSTVKCIGGIGIAQQVSEALGEIETQLLAYPDELIGVLCPKQSDLQLVAERLAESSVAAHVHVQHGEYTPFDSARRVILATIHGAKGLEFRAVHLLAMDNIKRFPTQKNMAYTAVTRCKTSLRIYHEGSLPGYLEKGIAACEPPPSDPPLEDLFL